LCLRKVPEGTFKAMAFLQELRRLETLPTSGKLPAPGVRDDWSLEIARSWNEKSEL